MSDHDGHTVSIPSARQIAIEAMTTSLETMVPWDRFDVMVVKLQMETAIDAIPPHVLACLAIERGGLERVPGYWWEAEDGPWDSPRAYSRPERLNPADTPLYRFVPAEEGE